MLDMKYLKIIKDLREDSDKSQAEIAKIFHACGFRLMATGNTWEIINEEGIPAVKVRKQYEGRPNILDAITNGKIDLIVNTPVGKESTIDDSYIRKNAIKNRIPYITTMAAAIATATGIRVQKKGGSSSVRSLQDYHASIQ